MKRLAVSARWLLPLALWFAAVPASASSSYFTSMCVGCHDAATTGTATTSATCNGCHAHGTHADSTKSAINVKGATNATTYAPGATVTVTITGGYRTGWVRAILYDQNMKELARSTGPNTMGGGAAYPITLTGTAPTTAGTYTWNVAWYGNEYDVGVYGAKWTPDATNPNHGQEIVATNSFTVSAPTAPAIALNPGSLAFGNVNVGASSTKTTLVQNTGNAPLSITAVGRCTSPATSAEFTVSSAALPITVAAGSSTTLTAVYAPTDATTDTGCIAVTSNASNGAVTNLSVSGTGVVPAAPKVAVSPLSLAFGNVTVGAPISKTFSVANTGTAALTGTVALASGTSAEYAVSPSTLNVAAGASQTVTVTYTPADTTTDSGNVVVATNDTTASSVSVAVSATGVAAPAPSIALSPASLSFGTVTVGGTASLNAQIQNPGTASLTVSAINRCTSPATSADFTWSPAAPITVAPGGSATLSVSYKPSAAGAVAGCLALASNDTKNATVNLAVSGTGQAPAAPKVAVSPTSLSFGSLTVNTSASKSFTVSNTGNAALTGTITAGSGTSGEYTFSPSTLNVAAGSSQTVNVTYKPVDTSTDAGALLVATNDATSASVSVSLSGTGTAVPAPAIALSPASLSFGTVILGNTASLSTQIQNAGTASLTVTGVTPCTGTSAAFTASPAAPITVAPGASATLAVTYAPTTAIADSGCLAIASNDAAKPSVSLSVSGTGAAQAAPVVALSTTSLDFGAVTVGASATRTATVKNTGNAALQVSGVALCSGTSAEFQVSPAGPFSVAAGASQTLTLAYAPADAGADQGCVAVASNDATTPSAQLAIQGSGTVPPPPGTDLLDVDITSFQAIGRADDGRIRSVSPVLRAVNHGTVDGTATATLVGVLNGNQVYKQTLPVALAAGANGSFTFPRYSVPYRTRGSIAWTLTLDDADPDVDVATATTWLGGYRGDSRDDLAISPVAADLVDAAADTATPATSGPQAGGCNTGGASAGLLAIAAAAAAFIGRRVRRTH